MEYKEAIGTKENPLKLKTPPLSSDYTMHVEEKDGRDWIELGSKDEKQVTKEGTVEHWGRSESNPVGGWYVCSTIDGSTEFGRSYP
jgi:hypothetical protein